MKKRTCDEVRRIVGTDGPRGLRDDGEARRHAEDCAECLEYLEAASEVDQALAGMPPVAAPDEAVARLLRRLHEPCVEPAGAGQSPREIGRRRDLWILAWGSGVAACLLLALFAPRRSLLIELSPHEPVAEPSEYSVDPPVPPGIDILADPSRAGTPESDTPAGAGSTGEDEEAGLPVPRAATELWAPRSIPEAASRPDSGSSASRPAHQRGRDANPGRASRHVGTGGIMVVVVDGGGLPLPGATVTISHELNYVETSGSLSDRRGVVEFPVLRPAPGYEISAVFPGFKEIRQGGLRVRTGEMLKLPIKMIEGLQERVRVVAERDIIGLESTAAVARFSENFVQDLPVPGRFYQNVVTLAPGVNDADGDGNPNVHGSRTRDFSARVSGARNVDPVTGRWMHRVNPNSIEEMEVISTGAGILPRRTPGDAAAARAFLDALATLEGLEFQRPSGYWANTYVPGDPSLRLLQSRLATGSGVDRPWRLHRAARRVRQPFDPPQGAALAAHLDADRLAVDGEERVLLQVGLQGTRRRAGRRTAMNVGLVLDLGREIPTREATTIRALVDAFRAATATGDRFSLVVAGVPGALAVAPEDFRHGPLTVALDRLLNDGGLADAPNLDLETAVQLAMQQVGVEAENEEPLGASAVLLVTSGGIGSGLDSLERLAHRSAVEGIQLGAIGVGPGVNTAEIDRLVLAGQGSRRLIDAPSEARRLVDLELSSVSRTVARAVRIHVRLAPGVRLIQVVGSERLDAARSEEVRVAERSIDRRIARDTGIRGNRGADDDGIQIVVPGFHADDGHVILLEVVVPGPGPVAELTVRYKDLVYLSNGTVRRSLALERGSRPRGPLQLAVLRNLLALQTSRTLERAADLLHDGNDEEAATALRELAGLLGGLQVSVHGLASDTGLSADREMLDEYAGIVDSGALLTPEVRAHVTDSLRFSGLLKILAPPVPLEAG